MQGKIRLRFLLSIIVVLLSMFSYGQYAQHPPEPRMMDMGTNDFTPCEEYDPSDPSQVPPPGLCMPINDYIIPFLLVGIIYGTYKIQRIEQA